MEVRTREHVVLLHLYQMVDSTHHQVQKLFIPKAEIYLLSTGMTMQVMTLRQRQVEVCITIVNTCNY